MNSNLLLDMFANKNEKLRYFSESTLKKLLEIYIESKKKIQSSPNNNYDVFASTGDARRGDDKLNKILTKSQIYYEMLTVNPADAKVVIEFISTGELREYYVCRATPPPIVKNAMSYNSPMGRLAALEVGEEYDLGEETMLSRYDDEDIRVIQKSDFTPEKNCDEWDAIDVTYKDLFEKGSLKIRSLINFFHQETCIPNFDGSKKSSTDKGVYDFEEYDEKILAELNALSENEENTSNISYDRERKALMKFSLRDQFILDLVQDEIFRLPLNTSLFLFGPAGTGKTTTLIRRLGQKIKNFSQLDENFEHLDDREKSVVELLKNNIDNFNESSIEEKWIMFTPTELLKSYLKESFNHERIPATDSNIKTWDIFKENFGRECNILRSARNKSAFELDDEYVSFEKIKFLPVQIFKDLYEFFIESIADEFISTVKKVSLIDDIKEKDFIKKLESSPVITNYDINSFILLIIRNKKEINDARNLREQKRENIIKLGFAREASKNSNFIHDMCMFIQCESQSNEPIKNNEYTKIAYDKYKDAILYLSQNNQDSSKKTQSVREKILAWLGERVPNSDELVQINHLSDELKSINNLTYLANNTIKSINKIYINFRNQRKEKGKWYSENFSSDNKINSTELDLLILLKLTVVHRILRNTDLNRMSDDSWLSELKKIKDKMYIQVFVDEAPDFSPFQLSSMYLLSNNKINSFFACGDFNQRLTTFGTKNISEIYEILQTKNIINREILTPYRQSEELYTFSQKILCSVSGDEYKINSEINEPCKSGITPAVGSQSMGDNLIAWLVDRILEIEEYLDGKIPSVALLVPDENFVKPLAEKLQKALRSHTSVPVQACSEGQTIGNDNAIRIFDVAHIKGAEFEAAFFISIDKLEELYPDLLGNYLYVGTSRAKTFLGISYENKLPELLKTSLGNEFCENWKHLHF